MLSEVPPKKALLVAVISLLGLISSIASLARGQVIVRHGLLGRVRDEIDGTPAIVFAVFFIVFFAFVLILFLNRFLTALKSADLDEMLADNSDSRKYWD